MDAMFKNGFPTADRRTPCRALLAPLKQPKTVADRILGLLNS